MSTINNVFKVIGNVTRDVELRHTSTGMAMATYTLAVDNIYCNSPGTESYDSIVMQ